MPRTLYLDRDFKVNTTYLYNYGVFFWGGGGVAFYMYTIYIVTYNTFYYFKTKVERYNFLFCRLQVTSKKISVKLSNVRRKKAVFRSRILNQRKPWVEMCGRLWMRSITVLTVQMRCRGPSMTTTSWYKGKIPPARFQELYAGILLVQ